MRLSLLAAKLSLVALALVAGCSSDPAPSGVAAYDLEAARRLHFLAAPYPSDLRATDKGTSDFGQLPAAEGVGRPIFEGYARRLGTSVRGFGLTTAIYQKLSLPLDTALLEELSRKPPETTDPVLLFPLEASSAADLTPLALRFIESAGGDPYLANGVLTALPRDGAVLLGATRYAFVLRSGLKTSEGGGLARDPTFEKIWSGSDAARSAALDVPRVRAALERLGVSADDVASATVFTTQDVSGELAAIRARVEASLTREHLELRDFKEVSRIEHTAGLTVPNEKTAVILKLTYTDGSTASEELDPEDVPAAPLDVTAASFPYRVFEGRLRTINLQGLGRRPYGSPGLGLLSDGSNDTGQIVFGRGPDGKPVVTSDVEPEDMRVVVQVPKAQGGGLRTGGPVLIFDHGTGGTAYNALVSPDGINRLPELHDMWAAHDLIIVSRDQPLFGLRFPKAIDRGYNIFLVAYNVGNITAFRDVLRQSTADNHVLTRWITEEMNTLFTARGLSTAPIADTSKIVRFGHSLGSVTTHLGVASAGAERYRASFVSGSGGLLTNFLLDSGLLSRLAGDAGNLGSLLELLDIDPAVGLTPRELLGALAGVPKGAARAAIQRDHPILTLAQTILDPADPITHARNLELPITLIRAPGDRQVPNTSTDLLVKGLPDVTVVACEVSRDYDPHQCGFREEAGLAAMREWLARTVP